MLVSATEMLKKAKEGHYAVGQFNINNLEWTKSVLLTAEELMQSRSQTATASKYISMRQTKPHSMTHSSMSAT